MTFFFRYEDFKETLEWMENNHPSRLSSKEITESFVNAVNEKLSHSPFIINGRRFYLSEYEPIIKCDHKEESAIINGICIICAYTNACRKMGSSF